MVEILLVILLIGLLSVASFSAYNGSVSTFQFLANYKSAMGLVRTARAYSIANRESETVKRYGVKIEDKKIILFEDTLTPFSFTDGTDTVLDAVDLSATSYEIQNVSKAEYLPATLFYEVGSGELSATYGEAGISEDSESFTGSLISKTEYPYVAFKFTDGKLSRYIVVFQVSGLVEDFYQSPIL